MKRNEPPTETQLRRRVGRANKGREKAEREWRDAILAAHKAGISSRRIGEWVALTHTRVQQIIKEEKDAR